MTAAARPRASPARRTHARARLLVPALFLCSAAPAAAEVGAAVSIFSDARFRGYSLSGGRPVAIADLSYDDPGGLYGAFSASAVLGNDDGIRPLAFQLNGGFAKQVRPDLALDLGVIHSSYSRYASRGSNNYTEVYAGVRRKAIAARVAYSPHYFEAGARTLYGELDAELSPAPKLRLNGHFGLLFWLDYPYEEKPPTQHDWRIGASREVGPVSLHLIVTGGGPGRDYYRGRWHSRTALVAGLSWPL